MVISLVELVVLTQVDDSTSFSPIGHVDISRRVGENNIIIMCPTFKSVAPIWRISNYTYGSSSLLSPFQPAYDNLLIPFVKLMMDQFTFQCFVPTGVGLEVLPSSVGTLTVDSENVMKRSNRALVAILFNKYHITVAIFICIQ